MSKTVLELIQSVIKDKKLIPGTAYVVFSCGCVFLQDEFNETKRVFKTRNGKSKTVCPNHPEFENEYLGRYRICARCYGEEAAKKGRGFETNLCRECNNAEWAIITAEKQKKAGEKSEVSIQKQVTAKRRSRTKYFQHGELIEKPETPETEPMCKNRSDCLTIMLKESDSFLHCKDCPYKEILGA
jgi:hypothetical protein